MKRRIPKKKKRKLSREQHRTTDHFIRSLRGCMKGSGALQFLLAERRKDNARNK